MHVRPPGGCRHLDLLALTRNQKAKPLKHAPEHRERNLDSGEGLKLTEREIDNQLRHLWSAGDRDLGRRAPAEIEHHPRRLLQPREQEGRIDAALEAVARIRADAELAAG